MGYSTDDIMVDSIDNSMYYGETVGMTDYDMNTNIGSSSGIDTHIILYIVIGVCAILGLVLGIILGRKAAYK